LLSKLRKRINEHSSKNLIIRVIIQNKLSNVFVLKIAMKLRETNALNLENFFYKKIKNVIKIKEIRTLKLLIATNLNVH